MRIRRTNLWAYLVSVLASLVFLSFVTAAGQGTRPSTPNLNQRIEAEKLLRDNERFRRGMEADIEARAKTKEERRVVANEAFVRIKALHNEIVSVTLESEKTDPKRVSELVTETKKRAIQLRANLDLPSPGKDEKSEKSEEAVVDSAVNDSLSKLCDLIRSFVTNLNESPTNNKAGERARRDLDGMVGLSEKILAVVGPGSPKTN